MIRYFFQVSWIIGLIVTKLSSRTNSKHITTKMSNKRDIISNICKCQWKREVYHWWISEFTCIHYGKKLMSMLNLSTQRRLFLNFLRSYHERALIFLRKSGNNTPNSLRWKLLNGDQNTDNIYLSFSQISNKNSFYNYNWIRWINKFSVIFFNNILITRV